MLGCGSSALKYNGGRTLRGSCGGPSSLPFVPMREDKMIRTTGIHFDRWIAALVLGAGVLALLLPASMQAQVFRLSKEELTELTTQNPFERFPDGRPKIPDALIERARGLSSEEMMNNQFADGFEVLHPGKKMVGRAFTLQFMPVRPDLDAFGLSRAKQQGITRLSHQTVLDMLQPGDVLVVDLMGRKDGGTLVGDNLFYYVMTATHGAGIVIDGSIRDWEGIRLMDMPAYFRHADPSILGKVTVSGWNIPIHIGNATVLPGDLVVGDREGVNFIAPAAVEKVLDTADTTHIHDEWTRMKFDTGKYKSSEIYSGPRDPELKKEYAEYLKKRLEEIRSKK
jgi:4-hydroxy-4-methyl-2-oxoglutarate aldolase